MYYMCSVSKQLAVTNRKLPRRESLVILYWGTNCTTLLEISYHCSIGFEAKVKHIFPTLTLCLLSSVSADNLCKSFIPEQARCFIGPDLDPNC